MGKTKKHEMILNMHQIHSQRPHSSRLTHPRIARIESHLRKHALLGGGLVLPAIGVPLVGQPRGV